MEIVIKIDEETYAIAKRHGLYGYPHLSRAIADGTPLPKGHGDLIDSTKLRYKVDEDGKILITSETIIEADKESDSE